MKLSIFSRLVVGYCALLVLVTGTIGYTVMQLNRVRYVTRSIGQKNILAKIKNLDEAEVRSGRIAFVITGASLLFGIILSVLITRSITAPISEMKKKTREIASGIFKDNLNLTSPPEIGGRIWVESEPGEGSTFYFTVPDNWI